MCGYCEPQCQCPHRDRQCLRALQYSRLRGRLRLPGREPSILLRSRLQRRWIVLRSSFLPRFSHRLLTLAPGFGFFCFSFFLSFLSSFTNGGQAFDCATFVEFTFCNRAGGWVASDNKELLSRSPEVGGGPVEQDTDREVEHTDRKDCWKGIQHNFLSLRELSGGCRLGHVLTHQSLLQVEHRCDHENDQDDGDNDDIEVEVFTHIVFEDVRHLGAGK